MKRRPKFTTGARLTILVVLGALVVIFVYPFLDWETTSPAAAKSDEEDVDYWVVPKGQQLIHRRGDNE